MEEQAPDPATFVAPPLLYGTAWKEERTEQLVRLALEAGFRGIDTANQRRHYFEEGVGRAIQSAFAAGIVRREELFLQTKFTYRDGQDHRLPYQPDASPATQVRQSFQSSLEHLGVAFIDSLILHGPSQRRGLSEVDRQVWRTFEELHGEGLARLIGVSNIELHQLELLCRHAKVRPSFVQNRCYARSGWDREIRTLCSREGIIYQGFSLLTANTRELRDPELLRIARAHGRSVPQIIFRFAIQAGMLPLTGTTDAAHMKADLDIFDFELDAAEMETIERPG